MKINVFVLLLLLSISVKFTASLWPEICNDDMAVDDICYVVSSSAVSYSIAESRCGLDNGILAVIKDVKVNMKISYLMIKNSCTTSDTDSSRVWIGLTDRDSEGSYRYSDRTYLSSSDYQPWASSQPSEKYSRYSSSEDCISMSASYGQWYDDGCGSEKRYVCQYKSEPCNIKDIDVENAEYDKCYTNSEVKYGTKLTIHCHEGYILEGSSEVKCMSNSLWSQMPKCLKGCGPPPPLPNARLTVKKDNNFVGDTASYICNEGYFSNKHPEKTDFTITCSPNSQWLPHRSGCSHPKKYVIKGVEMAINESVTLICDIPGMENNKSIGDYVWFKDSNDFTTTVSEYALFENGDLILYDDSDENIEGLYMCFINGETVIPGRTVYDVKRAKVIHCNDDAATHEKTEYVYKEGASALLSCPHNSSYGGFHWFKDGKFLLLDDDHILYPDGTLYIRKIEFSHLGTYTCMMTIKDTFCSKNITAEVTVLASEKSLCGNPSRTKEHPWTVSLWWKDEVAPFCYGALIHENWIVTTAQCLSGLYRKRKLNIFARFGNDHISEISSKENAGKNIIDIPIETVKIHPLFSKKRYLNDIGLVKLKQSIQFSNNIQPICFTKTDLTVKTPCDRSPPIKGQATGWGSLERDDIGEMALLEETMTYVPLRTCFPFQAQYDDKILCLEKTNETKATFAGDSGSPLEVLWKDRIYLMGIYSWGDRIALLGEYDYFTKISSYVPWISSFINGK